MEEWQLAVLTVEQHSDWLGGERREDVIEKKKCGGQTLKQADEVGALHRALPFASEFRGRRS